jgi:WD40 repeat protein
MKCSQKTLIQAGFCFFLVCTFLGGVTETSAEEPKPSAILDKRDFKIRAVVLSADGKTLAWGAGESVTLYDLANSKKRGPFKASPDPLNTVRGLAMSSDGKTLAIGGSNMTVSLWDVGTAERRKILTFRSYGLGWVDSLAFTPEGKLLATLDETVLLIDTDAKKVVRSLKGQALLVQAICLGPKGKTLVTAHSDGAVGLWRVETGENRATWEAHKGQALAAAISPDGKMIVSGGDDMDVKMWDAADKQLKRSMKGHSNKVRSLAFSPDGRLLASGSADDTVRIWDAATGEQLAVFKHEDTIQTLVFSPDGKSLFTGCDDGSVRQWNTAPSEK